MKYLTLKSNIDLLFGVIVSLVFVIPFLGVALFLIFYYRSINIFFVQTRLGRDNRIFKIYKLKTMNEKRDSDGNLLPDHLRLTKIGKILRSSSIDEMPQLYNILKGEMSFVGPRPLLTKYLSLYSAEQNRRHQVNPGITGWAQVNGRNNISWDKKFELDVWYVDNLSFLLDLRILFLTFLKVIRREGISGEGVATMEPFTGSK